MIGEYGAVIVYEKCPDLSGTLATQNTLACAESKGLLLQDKEGQNSSGF